MTIWCYNLSKMQYRRIARLKLTPLILAVLILVAFLGQAFAFVAAILGLYWVGAALVQSAKRLTIDGEQISMAGYFGGAIVIRRMEVSSVSYQKFRGGAGGSFEVCFLKIRSTSGRSLAVWRYGWGRSHRALFRDLTEWLNNSSAEIDYKTQQILQSWAR